LDTFHGLFYYVHSRLTFYQNTKRNYSAPQTKLHARDVAVTAAEKYKKFAA